MGSAAPSFIWCETVKARASPFQPDAPPRKVALQNELGQHNRNIVAVVHAHCIAWPEIGRPQPKVADLRPSHGPDHLAFERQDQEARGRPTASAEAGEI